MRAYATVCGRPPSVLSVALTVGSTARAATTHQLPFLASAETRADHEHDQRWSGVKPKARARDITQIQLH